ncbi:MAG TPA: conserved phage C-terminal domain-containing protein [Gammaproteobacteria bacterium]|jgi:uncharacterized phage protein (TIGR02220 family)|nr:conserved phage C-terminal domain-containing protein [Gammaproteobacteria bacterium]
MRSYGNIPTNFWELPEIRQLSDQAKLLATYLMTGPHSNMLGCFRLPDIYVTDDLCWDIQKVKNAFTELVNIKFICRDEALFWLVICDYLKTNKIQNLKQGICIRKMFSGVPDKSSIVIPLVDALLTYGTYLPSDFIQYLQKLKYGIDTVSQLVVAEQEQNQDQKQEQNQEQNQNQYQEQERGMAVGCASAISKKSFSLSDFNKNQIKQYDQYQADALEVLTFLNEHAKKAYEPTSEHLRYITERLKDGASVEICRCVIAKKTRQWQGKESLEANLNPVTLFRRENFNRYKGELVYHKEESHE